MKILLAADGSVYSRHMLDFLAAHPALFNGDHVYAALTVVLPVPPHPAAAVGHAALKDYYAEKAKAVLQPLRLFFEQRGVALDAHYRVGHPAEQIARFATDGNYDMLLMGSHGHSALASLLMGSVVAKVLAHCKTPVLLVR